jgi:hypothetical protein
MKLFISWSGNRSREVADLFGDWIPNIIQAVDPWISTSDIEKGTRWGSEISSQLQEAKFGLICLTSENLNSPWILFEAGALSKTLEKTFVCPYLLDVELVDLQLPLAQFQATKSNKEDTRKLVHTINKALEKDSIEQPRLDKYFDRWWPDLEKGLARILSKTEKSKQAKRNDREILEELLLLVRSFAYTNEHLVSKIQQAFPHLNQQELSQLIEKLLSWYGDSVGKDNKPAKVIQNPDGSISVRVLGIEENKDSYAREVSSRAKRKSKNK